MLEFAFLLMLTAALVALLVNYRRGRTGHAPERDVQFGTLDVTGVSPRPEAFGEQFVTITGRLSGPTITERVVYGRFVWDEKTWPAVGDSYNAIYPSGKPDHWELAR